MFRGLVTNYYEATAMIVFGIGFTTLLLNRNIIKKIIGFNFMDTAVYLFLASKGYITGRIAPIVVSTPVEPEAYINPIPSGLVLTGIVVSVSFSAFFLALAVRLYKAYGTLDLDGIISKMQKEQGVC
ncbi:sodium:proton antiporter [Enterocloster aldenensis]|uniref:sodium:proton antiporter n=1 Tax=Enterocloster aldenensis TaxID=358742 RepID=UPI000E5215F6|nr:cation:proton antiporter [Enterocloster aldenensis]